MEVRYGSKALHVDSCPRGQRRSRTEKWFSLSKSTYLGYNHLRGRLIWEAIVTHCAGMDVHQKNIVVCVMIGLPDETPTAETRSFPTTTKHLL
ncbi:hypothetical protein [Paenibacillus sp. RC84]|uniref:hypothetical protein n=1 Tax=Paenibacillus sp. RC84 TaxID=3156252 RepID=UPI00351554EA